MVEPEAVMRKIDKVNKLEGMIVSFQQRNPVNKDETYEQSRKCLLQSLIYWKMYAKAVDDAFYEFLWIKMKLQRGLRRGGKPDLDTMLYLNDQLDYYLQKRLQIGEWVVNTAQAWEQYELPWSPSELQTALSIPRKGLEMLAAEGAADIRTIIYMGRLGPHRSFWDYVKDLQIWQVMQDQATLH